MKGCRGSIMIGDNNDEDLGWRALDEPILKLKALAAPGSRVAAAASRLAAQAASESWSDLAAQASAANQVKMSF
jgi:hypothetical protein